MEITKFTSLIDEVIKMKISDVHLTTDSYPYIRNKVGDIVPVESYGVITQPDMDMITQFLL